MKQTLLILVGAVVVSMILFGCKGGEGPQGPAGTGVTGNFHGRVQAYDNFGTYLGFIAGVQATAEGTSYAGISDSLGNYVITGLPTGTYNIVLTKAGFGTMKLMQVRFVGRGDFYSGTTLIVGLPNFEASTATASITAGSMDVTGTVTGGTPPISRQVFIYISKVSTVNSSIPSSYEDVYSDDISASTNTYALNISVSTLINNYGFASGETVYVAVYSVSANYNAYYDPASERYVYSGIGSVAKTASALIP